MGQKNKKLTIFRIFLTPLIVIMLVQSGITIGTLMARRTAETLDGYSSGMMVRLVENRRVLLQNDMNQRWAATHVQEVLLTNALKQFLKDEGVGSEEAFLSGELKGRLLERFFPICLDVLKNNTTSGIFLILTGGDMEAAGEFDGFFVRDSDPESNPLNYTDLLLERGNKQLARDWNIPLDTMWMTRFSMEGIGRDESEKYFYEPWRAGAAHMDADTVDLGYWSLPFTLEAGEMDAHEMITYSLPLRYEGKVYGVLGVEVSSRKLYEYFPVAELNADQQAGYMLAVRKNDDSYVPLVGKGMLYNLICSEGENFILQETKYTNLSKVQDVRLNRQGIYAAVCPLKLYSNNVPYEDTEWVLLGVNTEEELFGMSRRLYFWVVVAVLIGLGFGVFGIYVLVHFLTRPVQRLMHCISGGRTGLQGFKLSNILEIDALYDVVRDLTERQKEAENILLEEKERYKLALESTTDIFFSYDLRSETLDIVNHATMSGQWPCPSKDGSLLNSDYVYEADRVRAQEALRLDSDNLYAEFRMKWPKESNYFWVALSGKMLYDTEGQRRKVVGSIRNIQEQKEREEEQRRKNTTDSVTGLYVFGIGMDELAQCRAKKPEGIMACLFLDGLREANEKNGIVFGDMILEAMGRLLGGRCLEFVVRTGRRALALRLNQDKFVLWMEGCSADFAAGFMEEFLDIAGAEFDSEAVQVRMYVGLAQGEKNLSAEELIRRAKLAQQQLRFTMGRRVLSYEEIEEESRAELPALRGQTVNSIGYDRNAGLVSVALNLFAKGVDFAAQMALILQKIGRYYRADGVLVTLLRADFHSNYLDYRWMPGKGSVQDNVRKYTESDRAAFYGWLGESEARYFSEEDSLRREIQCFMSVTQGQKGIVLPLYDSGNYMGNICILGLAPDCLENAEDYQNLAELGRVIQVQLNQQQHDIASRAKSEFLSRMSHEIRTPMNGIIGMTAIALQQNQSKERVDDCLQKIQSSSNYLLSLINDILDMSKIESGKMKLELAHFNIDEMLGTIRELIASQAAAKGIGFVEEIELEHHWFEADRTRISQVLINLLGNALKFTPAGGSISLTVKETPEAAGADTARAATVYFAVRDTGIGIAKEDQDRVFRSFEQATGTNAAKYQGTGLGLSISNSLVQLMGSGIRLESEPGKGSIFSFAIPLAFGEDQGAAARKEEISFEGCSILVVEDNELNAEIAQCLLEERGFKVDCVHDGAQAVERMRETAPGTYDVILMDIMMPVMNGLDATRAIRGMEREDCRSIPIIAMSANAFDDDLKKSVECGMNGHLSKPVEVDKLYQTLNRVIREGVKI